MPRHLCSRLEKCYRPPRSPALHDGSHFLGDSSHFLMMELGCEAKSMHSIDKLGKSPSPLPLFHLLPTFPRLLNHPGQVCLTTFSCSRVFGGLHQKKKKQEHSLTLQILLQVPIPSAQECSWPFPNHLPPPPCPNQAIQLYLATLRRDALSSPTVPRLPAQPLGASSHLIFSVGALPCFLMAEHSFLWFSQAALWQVRSQ